MIKKILFILTSLCLLQTGSAQEVAPVNSQSETSMADSTASMDAPSEETPADSARKEGSGRQNIFTKIKDGKIGDFTRKNHWGVMGGLGPAIMHFDMDDIYRHYICNVRLGIVSERELKRVNENLFVEGAIEFQRKGYQKFFNQHADSLHTDYKEKTNLYYLVIPTTAGYKFHFHGFEFTPLFGPYYAIALGGRFKYDRETDDRGEHISQIKRYPMFGKKNGTERLFDTRRFDFGLRFAVGIEYFKGMRSSIGYDLGLVDVIKADFRGDKYKSKNSVFYISHTYFFK